MEVVIILEVVIFSYITYILILKEIFIVIPVLLTFEYRNRDVVECDDYQVNVKKLLLPFVTIDT